jgi:acyl phosphate:glycerol-3-phosphate acyltransferase
MPDWSFPLIAFLFGSVPFGFLIGRINGIDIRDHGSGNIGATNVWRTLGKKWGLPCFLLDVIKGLIPVLLAMNLLRYDGLDHMKLLTLPEPYIQHLEQHRGQFLHVLCGLCAILGHNFPPWVKFKGGKGIATSAGVLIALFPYILVIMIIAVWVIVFFTSRYVSLASIVAAAALPLLNIWGSFQHGKFTDGSWNRSMLAFSFIAGIMAIYKHRSNIQRLLNGTESRFSKKAKTPPASS